MKKALALLLALAAAPVFAQDDPAPFEDRARELFEGILDEMRPAMEGMSALVSEYGYLLEILGTEMAPALAEVLGQIDSITHYEPPVILPNGDIVLRRRADAPDWVPPPPPEEDEGEPGGPVDI